VSFLVDPPWLYANGRAYARIAPEEAQGGIAKAAAAACLAAYWGVGGALYLGTPRTRDFMVNWPALSIPAKRRTRGLDAGALAMFLVVYPIALWLGWDRGRRARPRG
jgi:hypothetical protein